MSTDEIKEVRGTFSYERDSRRYHRYRIHNESGITGTVYIPKECEYVPDQIVLEKQNSKDGQ